MPSILTTAFHVSHPCPAKVPAVLHPIDLWLCRCSQSLQVHMVPGQQTTSWLRRQQQEMCLPLPLCSYITRGERVPPFHRQPLALTQNRFHVLSSMGH